MNQKLEKKLAPLARGATIGLLAVSAPLSEERWQLGISTLESLGYKWKAPIDPTLAYGKLDHGFTVAGAAERTKAVYELLQDRQVAAILAVRGAYGSLDVLPRLDLEQIRAGGKTLIGSSDISVLLMQFAFRAGIPAIHGPCLGDLFADYATKPEAKESVDALLGLLSDPKYNFSQRLISLRAGSGRGPLIASNLTMLLSLLGTPWDIDYQGAVLVVEDVGEPPFRVHRAFTQLKLAGKLSRLAGLVFGRFAKCETAHGPTIDDVMKMVAEDIAGSTSYPILKGLEAGHWGKNFPLPLGCMVEIDGDKFALAESPLAG